MKNMLKIELKRAFANKWFWISVAIGCVVATLQVIFDVVPMTEFMQSSIQRNLPPHTIYNKWLTVNPTIWNTIFFTIFPLLAAIPFANSYHIDLKTGYVKNILTRTSKKSYYVSKYIAVFVSAGAAVVIPLIFNLYLTAMILPSITPSASAGFYPILETATFSNIYYANPGLYTILYLTNIFFVSGILASTALAFSYYIKYKYVITLVPYLCYIFVSFQGMFFSNSSIRIESWVNPCNNATLNLTIVILEITVIFIVTLSIYLIKGKRDDIY